MAENQYKLWKQLNDDKLYTKSYEEFKRQFSSPEKLYSLYTLMKSDGFYTKDINTFKQQYWDLQPQPRERIEIKDVREKDSITGEIVSDTKRLHAVADTELVRKIIKKAKNYGIDPYTALAISHQETMFNDEYYSNPMNLLAGNKLNPDTANEDFVDLSMQELQDKFKMAKKMGKKTDAEILQSWNGYGKIDSSSFGGEVKKVYGIDVTEKPIDMNKNPVYGKRVIDIRDNILKKNPDIVKLVNEVK